MTDYPIIEFKPIYGALIPSQKVRGMLVGAYLVVSYNDVTQKQYAIFNTLGRRVMRKSFANLEDAVERAEFLNEKYAEFFPIWETYPDADVFGWARWSVPGGVELHQSLCSPKE